MKRVHFICVGNVFRSLIAEAYLNSLQIDNLNSISSGAEAAKLGKRNIPVIKFIKKFLDKQGLGKYTKSNWDQLTQGRLSSNDITILMHKSVYDKCKSFNLPKNTIIWDIHDYNKNGLLSRTDKDLWEFTEKQFKQIKDNIDKLVKSYKIH